MLLRRVLSSSLVKRGSLQTPKWDVSLFSRSAYVSGTSRRLGTLRALCTSQINRHLKSEDSGPGQFGSYRDVFKDALFLVSRSWAQAVVDRIFAEVQQAHEKEVKELKEQRLSREKEMAEQRLSREKEMAEREKEMAEREKEMADQRLSREKEMAEEKFSMKEKISILEVNLQYSQTETLRSKGLLTSRGVLEMALMQVHIENLPKKDKTKARFNAHTTCDYLDDTKSARGTGVRKLKQCYKEMLDLHAQSDISHKSVGAAYRHLYGLLSQEIHGYPWSGESVRHPTCCDMLKLYIGAVLVVSCTLQ